MRIYFLVLASGKTTEYVRLFEPNIKRDNEKVLNGYRIIAREDGEGAKKNP